MTATYYAAAPDKLARAPLDGGIAISQQEYKAALGALSDPDDTRLIVISDGVMTLALPPEPEPDPEPGPPTVDDLADYAAAKRRTLAHGSTTVTVSADRHIPVWADPESCSAILGLVVATNIDPSTTANWKGADGAFHALDAGEIVALGLGMRAYVQACFDAEAAVLAGIANETITTTQQIDAAAWPPNG